MKNFISTGFALLLLNIMIAQVPATVSEGSSQYPDMSNSFSLTVTGVDQDFAEDSWRRFIARHYGTTGQVDKTEEGDQMKSLGVVFPPLGNEKVDILAVFKQIHFTEDDKVMEFPFNNGDTTVVLRIWILRGDTSFLSPLLLDAMAQKVKNWLFAFDSQLDRTNFSKD